jgi:hypothetical protein
MSAMAAQRSRRGRPAGTVPPVGDAPPDLDLLAASLRADASDTAAFLEALAARLQSALPGQVEVQRKGGLLGGGKRVRRIAVRLGDSHYEIEGDHGSVVARRRSVVRGIALKSEELAVDAWIQALSGDLLTLAERSEQGRLALERLLTG